MNSDIIDAVCDRIRADFSEYGVSVVSTGIGTVQIELPADCPDVTRIVACLMHEFEATCDLSTVNRTPVLTVWVPQRESTPLQTRQRAFCRVAPAVAVAVLFFAGSLGSILLFKHTI